MNRAHAVLASIVVLACGTVASGFDPYPPELKKLMPRDQLEIFEKMEALCKEHHDQFFRIKDSKKRAEENEKLAAEARRLHEIIVNKLKTEGLNGWVAIAFVVLPDNAIACDGWQPIRLSLQLRERKVKGKIEDALNAIKVNDIVRFSTKADSSYVMPKQIGRSFGAFDQLIKIDSITSVEKVGTKAPPAKKLRSARRSRRS
jgi:hypothetical protein